MPPGSHRYNTIVWSGDITSSWDELAGQVKKGLNAMLTIPYWNSDTGGFHGGDWETMGELQARWFQFSIFTSITRLHGDRHPKRPDLVPLEHTCDPTGAAGGPIEPWVYGAAAESAIKSALQLRARLLPYLKQQVALTASHGQPVTRPLWFDFAADQIALGVESQFMWGPTYMVAPITQAYDHNNTSTNTQRVYFPGNPGRAKPWCDFFTKKCPYKPGSWADIAIGSPDTADGLSKFPLFY